MILSGVACSTGTASPDDPGGSDSGTASAPDSSSGSTTPPPSGGDDSGGGGGGGGSDSSSPSGPPSVCDGAGTRVLDLTDSFIDDFEEAAISPGWSSFNDVQPKANAFVITQIAGGAASTGHAGRYTGTGAKLTTAGGFGVGTVYNVAIDPAAGVLCIDISAFDGISFWAKAGTAGAKVSVNFVLPQTNMAGTDSSGRPNGGDCTSKCYNHPHASVTLSATWAQYTVKFSDASGGSAKVGTKLQELAWLSADSDWDFSLDEIAFYKGTPPPGAVGTGDDSDASTPPPQDAATSD
ncbi:MAG TPA: hypothetical protein VGI39_34420 [Polyangiaceae bacterium]